MVFSFLDKRLLDKLFSIFASTKRASVNVLTLLFHTYLSICWTNSYQRDWGITGISSMYRHFRISMYRICRPFCSSSCLLLASNSLPSGVKPFESAVLSQFCLLFTQSEHSPLTHHPTSSFGTRCFGFQIRQSHLLLAAFCLLKGWPNSRSVGTQQHLCFCLIAENRQQTNT